VIFFSLAAEEDSEKLVRCGVIIMSNFILDDNKKFTYMLAYMNYTVEYRTSICLHFLDSLHDCYHYLKEGVTYEENVIKYHESFSIFKGVIPLEDILKSTTCKPVETFKANSQKTYVESRNSIKFIESARECKLPISPKFKANLIKSLIYKY
jgi:hypothetical protein